MARETHQGHILFPCRNYRVTARVRAFGGAREEEEECLVASQVLVVPGLRGSGQRLE